MVVIRLQSYNKKIVPARMNNKSTSGKRPVNLLEKLAIKPLKIHSTYIVQEDQKECD